MSGSSTASVTAGSVLQLEITAEDGSGGVDTNYTGDHALTFSGASPSSNPVLNATVKDNSGGGGAPIDFGLPTHITFANGVATVGGEIALYAEETAVISATEGSISSSGPGDTVTVTVNSGLASHLQLSGSATQQAGQSQVLTVSAVDGFGNPDPTYTGSHNITFSGANSLGGSDPTMAGTPFGTPTPLTFSGGVATGNLVLVTAEAASLSATDDTTLDSSGYGLMVTVSGGSFTLSTASGTQTAGGSQTLTITAKDQSNVTDTSYNGSHTLTFSGASSIGGNDPTVAGTQFGIGTALTFTNGVATAALVLTKAEAASISASELSGPSTSSDLAITVSPGALASFSFSLHTPQAAGLALTGTNTLTALDSQGNAVTTFDASTNNVTVAADTPLSGFVGGIHGGAVLNQAGDFTSGVADLTSLGLTFTALGSSTGTFTATSGNGKTGTSGSVDVNVAAPSVTAFALTGSATQTVGASQTITITAHDGGGATVSSYSGSHTLQFSGGNTSNTVNSVAFGSDTTLTFTAGVASASIMLLQEGALTLSAGSSGESIAAAGTPLAVTVSPPSCNSGYTWSLSDHACLAPPPPPPPPACAAGSYYSSDQDACVAASVGYFVPAANATSPLPCSAGSFSASSGSTFCTPARAGYFVGAVAASTDIACAAETFTADAGSASCSPCPAAKTTSGKTGQSQCIDRPVLAVTAVSPKRGVADTAVTITLTGTGFTSASTVAWQQQSGSGGTCGSVTVNTSGTTLTCVLPGGAPAGSPVSFTVVDRAQSVTTGPDKAYHAAKRPYIGNVAPSKGIAGTPMTVTLMGTGFGTGVQDLSGITYGPSGTGTACTSPTFVSSGTVICVVGSTLAAGTGVSFVVNVLGLESAPSSGTYTATVPDVCASIGDVGKLSDAQKLKCAGPGTPLYDIAHGGGAASGAASAILAIVGGGFVISADVNNLIAQILHLNGSATQDALLKVLITFVPKGTSDRSTSSGHAAAPRGRVVVMASGTARIAKGSPLRTKLHVRHGAKAGYGTYYVTETITSVAHPRQRFSATVKLATVKRPQAVCRKGQKPTQKKPCRKH